MSRIDRTSMLMEIAQVVAKRSTCSRLGVGAVFARGGRVVTMGYNGVAAGMPHCNHSCNCGHARAGVDCMIDCQSQEPCTKASHAERNGIDFAARHGYGLEGTALYVTHSPCVACANALINVGVVAVTYKEQYRSLDGLNELRNAGVQIYQWS